MAQFSKDDYNRLKAFILDKDIPEIQSAIKNGKLTYKGLSLFYLYRIGQCDGKNKLSLNTVVSLNRNLLEEAKEKDKKLNNSEKKWSICGIPVLIKDNINTKKMATTAVVLALEKATKYRKSPKKYE